MSAIFKWMALLIFACLAVPLVGLADDIEPDESVGQLTYRLSDGWEEWPEDKRELIVKAMDEAVALYNKHSRFKKKLRVTYSPSTPTADANYDGHIRFGGTINTRTALHEMGHTLGVGTTRQWRELLKEKQWTGEIAVALLHEFDGPAAVLKGDRMHFWPYGLNYDREDGKEQRIRHIKMVQALCRDMKLPVFVPKEDTEPDHGDPSEIVPNQARRPG